MVRMPAYEGKGNFIFVSYSHKDSGTVYPFITDLFEKKYRVWYDEGIAPGSEWPYNIEVHLKSCSTVLVFVSENSLASRNCDNEAVNALDNKKKIIQYSLDGSIHPLLKDEITVRNKEELFNTLSDDLIGDGSGYDRELNNKRRLSLWNLLLGLAVLFIVALGAGTYGLNEGYFDKYLPGRNIVEEDITEKKEASGIQVDNSVIAQALLEQLSKEDLFRDVEFSDDSDKQALYEAIGFYDWGSEGELQYFDLTEFGSDDLYLNNCSDECLKLLKYLPNLKHLYISSDKISTLEALNDCPYLEEVHLNRNCFPIDIPSEKNYRILYET